MSEVPETLVRELRSSQRLLLTSHANPDGDAVGSTLAAARLLRQLGKAATVWLRDPVPRIYRALPGAEHIHAGDEPPANFPDLFDAVVVMECPSLDRTGLDASQGATEGRRPIVGARTVHAGRTGSPGVNNLAER